jgi:cytochrome c553
MKLQSIFFVLGVSTLFSACSSVERSRELGDASVPAQTLAQQVCSICHGVDGRAINPSFPNLAGQQSAYSVSQLKEFRSHNRLDPAGYEYMWGLSRHLTDQQIAGLAAYYAAQTPAAPSRAADAAALKEGRKIFSEGIADQSVPACRSCHGEKAEGRDQFPRLAYQHADYLVKQLEVFQRTDERPEGSVMKTVAHQLTAANIRAVALYLEVFPD